MPQLKLLKNVVDKMKNLSNCLVSDRVDNHYNASVYNTIFDIMLSCFDFHSD